MMSRPLRIAYPDAWYHVMNRGRRSESIFSDNQDYEYFIDLLIETSELWNVHVAAYCLMENHSMVGEELELMIFLKVIGKL